MIVYQRLKKNSRHRFAELVNCFVFSVSLLGEENLTLAYLTYSEVALVV